MMKPTLFAGAALAAALSAAAFEPISEGRGRMMSRANHHGYTPTVDLKKKRKRAAQRKARKIARRA